MLEEFIYNQTENGQVILQQLGANTTRVMLILAVFSVVSGIYALFVTSKISSSIGKAVKAILMGMEALRVGKLDTHVEVFSKDDLGKISQQLNETCQVLHSYVSHVNATMEDIAKGKLIYTDSLVFQGDFLTMQQAIIHMIEQERNLIQTMQTTSQQVTSASHQVSSSAQSLAQGATEQASSVEQLASAMDELSNEMSKAVEDANTTNFTAGQTEQIAQKANEKMLQMLEANVKDVLVGQSSSLQQINIGLEQINGVIQSNSASAEQSAAASEQLYAQSEQLSRCVENFVLN